MIKTLLVYAIRKSRDYVYGQWQYKNTKYTKDIGE